MPVTYRIDASRNLIHTTCTGMVTLQEVLDHFAVLMQDPNRSHGLDVLLDLTQIDSVPTSDELRIVTSQIAHIRPAIEFGRCAVAASREAMYGMSRMFEVYAEDHFTKVQAFRTLEQAAGWLGLTQP
ncbi:MAG TPA: hypothetical protein VFO06_03880 [Gemmatimonadales bacterium]|nr:hypothetical protein [Gemmatimonadales bacterium]